MFQDNYPLNKKISDAADSYVQARWTKSKSFFLSVGDIWDFENPLNNPRNPSPLYAVIAYLLVLCLANTKGGRVNVFLKSAIRKSANWALSAIEIPKFSEVCKSANLKSANFFWLIRKSQISKFLRWASTQIENVQIFHHKTERVNVRQSATQLPAHQSSLMATRAIPYFCLSPGTAQRQRNPEVKRFIRATLLFSQHL